MNVLQEILNWSENRPNWQRDALRRIVKEKVLSNEDIYELTEICKKEHGLSTKISHTSLENSQTLTNDDNEGKVNLNFVIHHSGVNALANEQKVAFGSNLTVVYGDNGAGKSGYTRILKSACRARGPEKIIGNVLSEEAPPSPSVTIQYQISNKEKKCFSIEGEELLRKVNVFDSHSAAIYLKEKTDVAFRPFGLDIFDKLSEACQKVQKQLENEVRELKSKIFIPPDLPEETEAKKLVQNLSVLTKEEDVKKLCHLEEKDNQRIELIEKLLEDLKSKNPIKKANEIKLSIGRYNELLKSLARISSVLEKEYIENIFILQKNTKNKSEAAKKLKEKVFSDELLPGTGSEIWKEMWGAAKEFSEKEAYPDKQFPSKEENTKCLLCQQELSKTAIERLFNFQEYVISHAEQEFHTAKAQYKKHYDKLNGLIVSDGNILKQLDEIALNNEKLASDIYASIERGKKRQSQAVSALMAKTGLPEDLVDHAMPIQKLEQEIVVLKQRVAALLKQSKDINKEKLSKELSELKARKILKQNEKLILDEIHKKRTLSAYENCIRDTRTSQISRKSSEVTKEVVTKQLQESFKNELKKFDFSHVEVELQEVGAERGSLYHSLVLTRAPNMELPKIMSEGEARCLSIAAFFAELSTASDPSAILFDDPVSSLDHMWRSKVAERLTEEAKDRQVIVFTHDVVFLLELHKHAENKNVDIKDQHLRRSKLGAGISSEELPWVAMKVKKRIGVLKQKLQEASKLFNEDKKEDYEQKAILIYGRLRETWERAFEEILLNGMIVRYRPSIQTQQIKDLSKITKEDCEELEAGMTKCSRWLPGHDLAAAENDNFPNPEELNNDIKSLEDWIKKINKARSN